MQAITEPPHAIKANPLLAAHGITGGLILRLQRYAMLGWLAFFLVSAVFALYVVVDKLIPAPVVAVDASGRVLGTVDYLDPSTRTDQELTASAQYFLDRYLSLNSATIYEDYAAALNMMSAPLREAKITELKQTGYLTQIDHAKSRSYLEFATGEQVPNVVKRRGLQSTVRLRGRMVMIMGKIETERPFDLSLSLTHIARNTHSTQGVQIDDILNH